MEPFSRKIASKFELFDVLLVLQVVLSVGEIFFVIINHDSFFMDYDVISQILHYTEAVLNFTVCFAIMFESGWQKKGFRKMLKKLDELDLICNQFHYKLHDNHQEFRAKFSKKFMYNVAITVINIIVFTYLKHQTQLALTNFFLVFSIQFNIIKLKLFHIIFYIDLLNYYLVSLNDQLEKIIEFINLNEAHLKNRKYHLHLYRQLRICKNYYDIVYDISQQINKNCGISMTTIVKMLHFLILIDAYWYDNQIWRIFSCFVSFNVLILGRLLMSTTRRE